ncbi:rhombosortase [uncultured Paraglaciecola sp.]|uniref:rhombosortase n=1 Tax=uncultured Paraglaciecola sp. TaxID=1765024 RepID=UPI002621685D|nr:rhombosortase [uncultured Paraglaciecola sp.]
MFNLPIERKFTLAPLSVILVCIILFLSEPLSSDLLAYDKNELHDFQWWRLITGHFLHTNNMHLVLNTLGLVLLWALHGHYYSTRHYLVILFLLCLGTSIGLLLFAPQMQWYVGLSGVLHGLFILGAYFDIQNKFTSGWIMIAGVWLKVIHEQIYGASEDIAQLIQANVAIDAHLSGTVSGCLVILFYIFNRRTAK